jgi:hypothetical protein
MHPDILGGLGHLIIGIPEGEDPVVSADDVALRERRAGPALVAVEALLAGDRAVPQGLLAAGAHEVALGVREALWALGAEGQRDGHLPAVLLDGQAGV